MQVLKQTAVCIDRKSTDENSDEFPVQQKEATNLRKGFDSALFKSSAVASIPHAEYAANEIISTKPYVGRSAHIS